MRDLRKATGVETSKEKNNISSLMANVDILLSSQTNSANTPNVDIQ